MIKIITALHLHFVLDLSFLFSSIFFLISHLSLTFFLFIFFSIFFPFIFSAKKKSHWVSSSGADMVRFFLPFLFPKISKILYLDNDVIVSCCLEEIWNTEMTENQVVGQHFFKDNKFCIYCIIFNFFPTSVLFLYFYVFVISFIYQFYNQFVC